MGKRKKKIIILGLCISVIVFLALYLGFFADREIPPFEVSNVYSLPLGEGEKIDVRYVTAVDLTGDGRMEVLMSYDVYSVQEQMIEGTLHLTSRYEEAKVVVLSGNTTGGFQKLWEYDLGLTRQTSATGDFDGDGKPDVVVGGFELENVDVFPPVGTSVIEVLLQEEDCAFYSVFSFGIPDFVGPGSIVADDFDRDGRCDFLVGGLAVGNESPCPAYVFHNEGGWNFAMSSIVMREGIIVEDMWKADIDGDGFLDLVIHATDLSSETHPIILLLNDGKGGFEFQELGMLAGIAFADPVVIADFTGNGYPDIIYTKSSEVYFLKNDQGEFAEPSPIDIRAEGGWLDAMIAGDFNNDGTLDAILFERTAEFIEDLQDFEVDMIGHLLVTKRGEDTSPTWEWSYKFLKREGISSKHAVATADINGNGAIDLILVCEDGEVQLALNEHN